jgi:hypothetical protein
VAGAVTGLIASSGGKVAAVVAGTGADEAAAVAAGSVTRVVLAVPEIGGAIVGVPEAPDLDCVDFLGRGAGLTSRQAPRFRTYSRASGETEAHGKGCAGAAVAPSNNAALTRHEILPRVMALHRLRAGNQRCSTGARVAIVPLAAIRSTRRDAMVTASRRTLWQGSLWRCGWSTQLWTAGALRLANDW